MSISLTLLIQDVRDRLDSVRTADRVDLKNESEDRIIYAIREAVKAFLTSMDRRSMDGYITTESLVLQDSLGDVSRYAWPTGALLMRKDKGVIQLVLDGFQKIPDTTMGLSKLRSLARSTYYGSKAKLNFVDIDQGFIYLPKDVVGSAVFVANPTIEAGSYYESSIQFQPKEAGAAVTITHTSPFNSQTVTSFALGTDAYTANALALAYKTQLFNQAGMSVQFDSYVIGDTLYLKSKSRVTTYNAYSLELSAVQSIPASVVFQQSPIKTGSVRTSDILIDSQYLDTLAQEAVMQLQRINLRAVGDSKNE